MLLKIAYLGSPDNIEKSNIIKTYKKYGEVVVDSYDADDFTSKAHGFENIDVFVINQYHFSRKIKDNFKSMVETLHNKFDKSIFHVTVSDQSDVEKYINLLDDKKESRVFATHKASGKGKISVGDAKKFLHSIVNLTERDLKEMAWEKSKLAVLKSENQSPKDKPVHSQPPERKVETPAPDPSVKSNVTDQPNPVLVDVKTLSDKERKAKEKNIKKQVEDILPFFDYQTSDTNPIQHKKIAVVNLYPHAGASFIANNFAIALAKKYNAAVGVLESLQNRPRLYNRLANSGSVPSEWICWYEFFHSGKRTADMHDGLKWRDEGVYWIPQYPDSFLSDKDQKDLYHDDMLWLYYLASSIPLLFIDVSVKNDNAFAKEIVFKNVDEIWVVLDCVTDRLRQEDLDNIKSLAKTKEFEFIVNNYSGHKESKKTIEEFIKKEPLTYIPSNRAFSRLCREPKIPYLKNEGREYLNPYFEPLYKRVLKDECDKLNKQPKNIKNVFRGLFQLKKHV